MNRESVGVLVGGDSADFTNSISTSLDLDGDSLAIGPSLTTTISTNWAWRASGGVTLALYKCRVNESENLNVSINGVPSTALRS